MFHKILSLYTINILLIIIFVANEIAQWTAICLCQSENSKGSL